MKPYKEDCGEFLLKSIQKASYVAIILFSILVITLPFISNTFLLFLVLGPVLIFFFLKSINLIIGILKQKLSNEEGLDETQKEKIKKIHNLIFSSAFKYMGTQYKTILSIGAVISLFLFFQNFFIGISFVWGVLCSCLTAVFNMYLCTTANLRVTLNARKSLNSAFQTAFNAGVSGSLFTIVMAIICLAGTLFVLPFSILFFSKSLDSSFKLSYMIFGTSFGCSFVCIFGRLAGGIFTKAADVGADLVGKVEASLAEDDIRNPVVIADNVGDNVGDGNGMIVDVFESYVVTFLMAALCISNYGPIQQGTLLSNQQGILMLLSTILCCVSLISNYFAKYFMLGAKGVWEKLQLYCYGSILLTGILTVTSVIFLFKKIDSFIVNIIICLFVGFLCSIGVLKSTEYYTSSKYKPVQNLAESASSGHGTNIIYGLSIYYLCVGVPLLFIIIGVLVSYNFLGVMGIMVSAMAMLSVTGPIVTLDLIGPITDNSGGIGEMSGMNKEVRDNTDHLDAIGNITKAMTKGFAIASATFTAIVTNMLFVEEVWNLRKIKILGNITNPYIFGGLIIGGIVTSVFCGLAMRSVGDAAKEIVLNVREQFKRKPEILQGLEEPDYMFTIAYLTKVSIKKMIMPALLPMIVPIISFYLYKYFIGMDLIFDFLLAISIGTTIFGIFTSISMTTAGGAWDNGKKYIEEGHFGGKGSETHKCAVTGDTVGDPLKDTAGPALNVLIKVMGIVISLFIIMIS